MIVCLISQKGTVKDYRKLMEMVGISHFVFQSYSYQDNISFARSSIWSYAACSL